MLKINGVFSASLTPVKKDFTINQDLYLRHCQHLMRQGHDGLAIFGTTGEANSFSLIEKKNNIILTNTPKAVRRPVAVASLTMILSLSGKLMIKDNLVREGRWNERTNHMGVGLINKTLGIVGFGGIGREFVKISKGLFKNIICYDPFVSEEEMKNLQVDKVDFDEIANSSDFLVILCDLNENTKGMIDSTFLNKMKSSSYLINLSN